MGTSLTGAPFIVSAELPPALTAALSALRSRFFPADRSDLPAHLTLLHAVPAAQGPALAALLDAATARADRPRAALGALTFLGRGFAVSVDSPGLARLRRAIAAPLGPHLTGQDRAPFRPHITLANKLAPEEARRRMAIARLMWRAETTCVVGLRRWRYAGGPWLPAGRWPLGAEDAT